MGTEIDKRLKNRPRAQLVRAQIKDLQATMRRDVDRDFPTQMQGIAAAMNANMVAGFCLELGLKLFFLTYYKEGARGHELLGLFDKLPAPIQADIEDCYAQISRDHGVIPSIPVFALQTSPNQPAVPSAPPQFSYETARDLLTLVNDLFVRSRYFAEEVGSIDWAMFPLPLSPSLRLSQAMDAVYDFYEKRGGWLPEEPGEQL